MGVRVAPGTPTYLNSFSLPYFRFGIVISLHIRQANYTFDLLFLSMICSLIDHIFFILVKQQHTATILPFLSSHRFCKNESLAFPLIRAYLKLPAISMYPNHFFACIIIRGMILYRTCIWYDNVKLSRFIHNISRLLCCYGK